MESEHPAEEEAKQPFAGPQDSSGADENAEAQDEAEDEEDDAEDEDD